MRGVDAMRRVYLDHSATTPVRAEVLAAMMPYFAEKAGNASSLHQPGQEAKRALERSRQMVARALGARPDEIFFTSGGTESDNLAILGTLYANAQHGRHVITSAIEHHAVLNTCRWLAAQGYEVTEVPVDRRGVIDLGALEECLRDDTVLVSVMLANNEVGTIQPVEAIADMAHRRGALVHTDAVQAIGKMPVEVRALGVDLLSLTAHKFGGPKGVGALYVRQGTAIRPLFHGGHHEGSLRPGTQNVVGAVGLAEALRLATRELETESQRLRRLRDRLEATLLAGAAPARVNGAGAPRLPNILNVGFPGVEGESLLMALDIMGVAVSTGSACAAGVEEISHVLQALGVDPAYARGSLRLSLGHDTTEKDIDYAATAVIEAVARLREVAPPEKARP